MNHIQQHYSLEMSHLYAPSDRFLAAETANFNYPTHFINRSRCDARTSSAWVVGAKKAHSGVTHSGLLGFSRCALMKCLIWRAICYTAGVTWSVKIFKLMIAHLW